MLIGLTGYAQHGKDTAAQVLVEQFGFTRFAFADALKSMALVLDPIIPFTEKVEGEFAFEYHEDNRRLKWLVDELGWEGAKQNPEVRRFLQVLGTEGVRDHLGPESWVDALESKLLKAGVLEDMWDPTLGDTDGVITDVRFPNEAAAVTRWGGQVWRVHRPEFDNGLGVDHPSEAFVAELPVSAVLFNTDGLRDFEEMVRDVARQRVAPRG